MDTHEWLHHDVNNEHSIPLLYCTPVSHGIIESMCNKAYYCTGCHTMQDNVDSALSVTINHIINYFIKET